MSEPILKHYAYHDGDNLVKYPMMRRSIRGKALNLILYGPEQCVDGVLTLDDRARDHVRKVLRAEVGDDIQVGALNAGIGRAKVVRLDRYEAILQLQESPLLSPPAAAPVKVVLALPRPQVLKRALMIVAQLGVKDIVLLHSRRVEKSYWQSPLLEAGALQNYLRLGLEQSVDTVMPTLSLHKRFKPFVEDHFVDFNADHHAILAHPYSDQVCPSREISPVTLIIGPEGGFIPYEVECFQQHGAQCVTLGPRILQVETALAALISRFVL